MSNLEFASIIVSAIAALGGLLVLVAYVGLSGQCTDHEEEQDMEGRNDE